MTLFDNKQFSIYRDADLEAFYDVNTKYRRKIVAAHAIVYFFPVFFTLLITYFYSFGNFGYWLIVFSLFLYAIAIVETASYLFPKSRAYYKRYFLWIIVPLSILLGLGGFFSVIDFIELSQNRETQIGTTLLHVFAGVAGVFLLFGICQFGLNQILRASKSLYTQKAKAQADIQFATEVQKRILQEVEIDKFGVSAYACSKPANDLGGDFFELSCRDDQLFASIGDISGHSFGAGLLMTLSKSALQTHLEYNSDPAGVMSALNTTLNHQTDRSMYATMTLMRLNMRDRTVTLCNGGHLPVLHIPADSGKIIHRYEKGIGLGITKTAQYRNIEFKAKKGDLLILYSDGLIETRDEDLQIREAAFLEELVSEIIESGSNSTRGLAAQLLKEVRKHDHSNEMEDDTSLIIIRV